VTIQKKGLDQGHGLGESLIVFQTTEKRLLYLDAISLTVVVLIKVISLPTYVNVDKCTGASTALILFIVSLGLSTLTLCASVAILRTFKYKYLWLKLMVFSPVKVIVNSTIYIIQLLNGAEILISSLLLSSVFVQLLIRVYVYGKVGLRDRSSINILTLKLQIILLGFIFMIPLVQFGTMQQFGTKQCCGGDCIKCASLLYSQWSPYSCSKCTRSPYEGCS